MKPNLEGIRTDYGKETLSKSSAGKTPFHLFGKWLNEALGNTDVLDANAFVLSTVDQQGFPKGRIVLLRSMENGKLVFFTNFESEKGKELGHNPKAAACFFWPQLERQIRVVGKVQKITDAESDAYFKSRPRGSKIGAWASHQSQEIPNREALDKAVSALETKFGENEIPRPEFWGGYAIDPIQFEFWQGRNSRLHDRIEFEKSEKNAWKICRLSP
ncbi:MAG: pyridoxamine 5'-phosphate oxidase [Sphingobacteriales bacterium]|jgi:pyridoxamine 5'-phosphate oxidase